MTEFYERMNIRNQGKTRIVDIIMSEYDSTDTLVIDVGAGSCVIEQMLVERGFKGHMVAIDHKAKPPIKNDSLLFLDEDAYAGVVECFNYYTSGFRRVVFVLSAILHELSKEDINDLFYLIRIMKRYNDIAVLIREPLFDAGLLHPLFVHVVDRSEEKFYEYAELHKGEYCNEQLFVNYCFAASYGPKAWGREQYEGRFTFTLHDIKRFADIAQLKIALIEQERDEFYKNTLPYGLYDRLNWTGNLIVMEGKKE